MNDYRIGKDPDLVILPDRRVKLKSTGAIHDGCYCHDGHKKNNTVCLFCWAHGRRHWNDPDVPDAEQG